MNENDHLRDEILATFQMLANYWADQPDVDPASGLTLDTRGRLHGLVFSILAQLDGVGALPPLKLVAEDGSEREVVDMLHEHYKS